MKEIIFDKAEEKKEPVSNNGNLIYSIIFVTDQESPNYQKRYFLNYIPDGELFMVTDNLSYNNIFFLKTDYSYLYDVDYYYDNGLAAYLFSLLQAKKIDIIEYTSPELRNKFSQLSTENLLISGYWLMLSLDSLDNSNEEKSSSDTILYDKFEFSPCNSIIGIEIGIERFSLTVVWNTTCYILVDKDYRGTYFLWSTNFLEKNCQVDLLKLMKEIKRVVDRPNVSYKMYSFDNLYKRGIWLRNLVEVEK